MRPADEYRRPMQTAVGLLNTSSTHTLFEKERTELIRLRTLHAPAGEGLLRLCISDDVEEDDGDSFSDSHDDDGDALGLEGLYIGHRGRKRGDDSDDEGDETTARRANARKTKHEALSDTRAAAKSHFATLRAASGSSAQDAGTNFFAPEGDDSDE